VTGTQQWEGDETCDQAGRGLHVHEVTVFGKSNSGKEG